MIIEWRRRQEKTQHERRKVHHNSRNTSHHPKPFHQPTPTFDTTPIPYKEQYFEKAILKITEGIVNYLDQNTAISTEILLQVPDENISEWFGRKVLKQQFNIHLTKHEMRCLCMKLRGEVQQKSSSSSSLPLITSSTPSHANETKTLEQKSSKKYRKMSSSSSSSSISSNEPSDYSKGSQNEAQLSPTDPEHVSMISGKTLKTLVINLRNMIMKRRQGHIPLLPLK